MNALKIAQAWRKADEDAKWRTKHLQTHGAYPDIARKELAKIDQLEQERDRLAKRLEGMGE